MKNRENYFAMQNHTFFLGQAKVGKVMERKVKPHLLDELGGQLGDNLLIVSTLKLFLFCLYLPFFFLLRKKVGTPPPGVAGPVKLFLSLKLSLFCLLRTC